VVVVAHRLATVRRCERIVLMREGRVAAEGTYDELVAREPHFQRMVAADEEVG
jgi:ABC-type multidrug transport system fused ATPase/permease subunit